MLNRKPITTNINSIVPGYSVVYVEHTTPTDKDAIGRVIWTTKLDTQVTYKQSIEGTSLPYSLASNVDLVSGSKYAMKVGYYDSLSDDPSLLDMGFDINFSNPITFYRVADIEIKSILVSSETAAIVGVTPVSLVIQLDSKESLSTGQMLPNQVIIEYLDNDSTDWNNATVLYKGMYSSQLTVPAPTNGIYKFRARGVQTLPIQAAEDAQLDIDLTVVSDVEVSPIATVPEDVSGLSHQAYRVLDHLETFELKFNWTWNGNTETIRTFLIEYTPLVDYQANGWSNAQSVTTGTSNSYVFRAFPSNIKYVFRFRVIGWTQSLSEWVEYGVPSGIMIDPSDDSLPESTSSPSVSVRYSGIFGYDADDAQTFGLFSDSGNFELGKKQNGVAPLFYDAASATLSIDGRTIVEQIYAADFVLYSTPGNTPNGVQPGTIRTDGTTAFKDSGIFIGSDGVDVAFSMGQFTGSETDKHIFWDGVDLVISGNVVIRSGGSDTPLGSITASLFHVTEFDAAFPNNAGTFSWNETSEGVWSPTNTSSQLKVSIKQGQDSIATATIRGTLNTTNGTISVQEISSSTTNYYVFVVIRNTGTPSPSATVELRETNSPTGNLLYSATISFTAVAGGQVGKDAEIYYIVPVNGSYFHNGINGTGGGTLLIEGWKVSGNTRNILSSPSDVKLYWGANEGYTKTFTAAEVGSGLEVTLEDRSVVPAIIYDSINLTNIVDGSAAIVAAFSWDNIDSSKNNFSWVKLPNGGDWVPSTTDTKFIVRWYKEGSIVGTIKVTSALSTGTGNLSYTITENTTSSGYSIANLTSGNNTSNINFSFQLKEGSDILDTWNESLVAIQGGAKGTAAATIALQASGMTFAKNPNNSVYTPDTVSISAAKYSTDGGPTVWSFNPSVSTTSNPGNFPSTPVLIQGDQVTIDNSVYSDPAFNSADNVLTVTASVSDILGNTVSDAISITEIIEGTDNIYGLLSNEAYVASADNSGSNVVLSGATGNFLVYRGAQDVSIGPSVSYSLVSAPVGVSASISVTGSYNVTTVPEGEGSADTFSIIFRATYTDPTSGVVSTIDKTFTVTKSKTGDKGNTGDTGGAGAGGPGTYIAPVATAGDIPDNNEGWSSLLLQVKGSGPVNFDVLTAFVDSDRTTAQTVMYESGNWSSPGQTIHGSLVVDGTVRAKAIVAENGLVNRMGTNFIVNSDAFNPTTGGYDSDYSMLIDLSSGFIHIK